jgi:hypothetical protein
VGVDEKQPMAKTRYASAVFAAPYQNFTTRAPDERAGWSRNRLSRKDWLREIVIREFLSAT